MTAATCDVLVIGLGPASAAAAVASAARCMSVIAIDRKKTPGVPVQCAEFVPFPLARHAQGAGAVSRRADGMRSFLPSAGGASWTESGVRDMQTTTYCDAAAGSRFVNASVMSEKMAQRVRAKWDSR